MNILLIIWAIGIIPVILGAMRYHAAESRRHGKEPEWEGQEVLIGLMWPIVPFFILIVAIIIIFAAYKGLTRLATLGLKNH